MTTWFPTLRRLRYSGTLSWPWYTTRVQQQSLLRMIAVATEENLPLAPLLEQWALDEKGVQLLRIRRLAALIAEGRSTADAVEAIPGVLSDEHLLALRFDAQSGTRTKAIRSALEELPTQMAASKLRFQRSLIYFAVAFPLAIILLHFSHLMILPKLQQIFAEFGAAQPPQLQWSSQMFLQLFPFLFVGALLALVMSIWLFGTQFGRRTRRWIAGRLFRSVHDLRSADVLQQMSVAVAEGRPIPGALSTLARYHFDPTIRHELLVARNNIEQEMPIWQSMAAAGLISQPEAKALQVAGEQGSPSWAMQQLVTVRRLRIWRRFERLSEFISPALVILLAAIVIYQACSVFLPLIQLMEGLL
ncbi:type II secretion system F family protein [Anatilimnocola sp. NA78]|uniref:type II secretion system F family protein n=1 Tax=Anatilimnocola sp. NA78 TaxID=3415683 RepID=UPI003CE48DC5